jgi:hypothetical protein
MFMKKNAIFIGVMSATIIMVGCSSEASSHSTAPRSDSKPKEYSDGTNTWYLGTTLIDGTNVATNATIKVMRK